MAATVGVPSINLFLLLWISVSLVWTQSPPQLTLPDTATVTSMLNGFNTARATVDPPALTAIPPLTYSTEAQASASSYAQTCSFDPTGSQPLALHSSSAQRTITFNGRANTICGENLYWTYRTGTSCGLLSCPQALTNSVAAWDSEKSTFQVGCPRTNSQTVVGHYSQDIWSTTQSVGCACECCSYTNPSGVTYVVNLVVCQYCPAGNINGYSTPYTPVCAPTCRAGEANLFTSRPACGSTTPAPATTTQASTNATSGGVTNPGTTPITTSTTSTTTTTTARPITTTTTPRTTPTTTSTSTTRTTTTTARPTTTTTTTPAPSPGSVACPTNVLRGALGNRWVRDETSGSCYMFVDVSRLGNTGFVPYTDVLRLSPFSTSRGPSHEVIISSESENMRMANMINAIARGASGLTPAAGATIPMAFKIGLEYFTDVAEWEWTQSLGPGPSFRCFGLDETNECLMEPPIRQINRDCAYYVASGNNIASMAWQTQSCENYRTLNGYVLIAEVPISSANADGPTEPAIQFNSGRGRSRQPQSRIIHDNDDEEVHSMVDGGLETLTYEPLVL